MSNIVILGAQWGDEGNGKIVDLLSDRFDLVARYQGGHNAGHTVIIADKKFILKLIPSGILRPGILAVIGNGLVIDPAALLSEIEKLRDHQKAIARLLKDTNQLRRLSMVTKEKWTQIMRGAGFTDTDMQRWHAEFEKSAPSEHQEFLEFLHIPSDEVQSIREWSRNFPH